MKKYSFEDFVNKVKEISNDTIDVSEFKYVNSITKGTCKCKICGHVWETRPDVLLRGCGCKKCSSKKVGANKALPFEEVQKQIQSTLQLVKSEYIDTNHVCKCVCTICDYEWNPRVRELMRGHGCPNCHNESEKRKHFEQFQKELNSKFNGRYVIDYKDYSTKLDKMRIFDNKTQEFIEDSIKHLLSIVEPTSSDNEFLKKDRLERQNRFIEKAKAKFGDLFDYSKVEYKNRNTKITIKCNKHCNEFEITPRHHLRYKSGGCKLCFEEKCIGNKRVTLEQWLNKCKEIHNNKYDYSEVKKLGDKFNLQEMVTIICPKHGAFQQLASSHYRGKGCDECAHKSVAEQRTLTHEEFEKRARLIHGDKYKYLTKYEGIRVPIKIECNIHGVFEQLPKEHLDGCGCPKCGIESARTARLMPRELFLKRVRAIHGNKYDYSKTEYRGVSKFMTIICPIHGEFQQTPFTHLYHKCGCPKCTESKLERQVRVMLEENNIEYVYEKHFDWLVNKKQLSLDFYLPKYNIAIECQGQQHFKGGWSISEGTSQLVQERDIIKRNLCQINGIELIYFLEEEFLKFVGELNNRCFTKTEEILKYLL